MRPPRRLRRAAGALRPAGAPAPLCPRARPPRDSRGQRRRPVVLTGLLQKLRQTLTLTT